MREEMDELHEELDELEASGILLVTEFDKYLLFNISRLKKTNLCGKQLIDFDEVNQTIDACAHWTRQEIQRYVDREKDQVKNESISQLFRRIYYEERAKEALISQISWDK